LRKGFALKKWDLSADVVIIGAGAAGLAAAVSACDHGAVVVVVEENYDIGGHAMLSGGRIHLGGGNALQKKFGITDSSDQVYADWINSARGDSRYNDRDLVRTFADECLPTFNFLLANGVTFIEKAIQTPDASRVPRVFVTHEWHIPSEVIAPRRNRNGSGLVRRLAESAHTKGAQILLRHEMTEIVREHPKGGRVLGIIARASGKDLAIEARKGVVIATGGHTGNVNFRRMFDPRLTEEYQQAGMPWSEQGADGELAAMDIGASLWATGTQTSEVGPAITKTRHIGTRWGYLSLYYETDSPIFDRCRATGLTVTDWQEAILVNQFGRRFWNELDSSYAYLNAALGNHGDTEKLNGGGPVWAIFDANTVARQGWKPKPPHVDPDGYFFTADTVFELAGRITNPYQKQPISGDVLQETVNRYNWFVASGVDLDFNKPTPLHPITKPPFHAAWATPILHDSLTGLRTDTNAQVIDIRGEVIPGLYCAGESQGGFAQHGLGRCLVFGRIAGRHAAQRNS
jgi:succinate dehydrogenase/fumarate reductase flavoprotein subunit